MLEKAIRDALILWATIDPIGTLALFLAVTAAVPAEQRPRIARRAVLYAAVILVGSIVVGQLILDGMRISLPSLQIAGGVILFLFGLQMIFGTGEKQPAQEAGHDLAVFPLAVPSIASPGAIMSAIILTDNDRYSIGEQALTGAVLVVILAATYVLMRCAEGFHRLFGKNGAAILIRAMGMLLAALAVEMVIQGVTEHVARHGAGGG